MVIRGKYGHRGIYKLGKQKYTEKRKLTNKRWDDANLRTCTVRMRIELYEQFEKYCIDNEYSKNKLINEIIMERLKRDRYMPDTDENSR